MQRPPPVPPTPQDVGGAHSESSIDALRKLLRAVQIPRFHSALIKRSQHFGLCNLPSTGGHLFCVDKLCPGLPQNLVLGPPGPSWSGPQWTGRPTASLQTPPLPGQHLPAPWPLRAPVGHRQGDGRRDTSRNRGVRPSVSPRTSDLQAPEHLQGQP